MKVAQALDRGLSLHLDIWFILLLFLTISFSLFFFLTLILKVSLRQKFSVLIFSAYWFYILFWLRLVCIDRQKRKNDHINRKETKNLPRTFKRSLFYVSVFIRPAAELILKKMGASSLTKICLPEINNLPDLMHNWENTYNETGWQKSWWNFSCHPISWQIFFISQEIVLQQREGDISIYIKRNIYRKL